MNYDFDFSCMPDYVIIQTHGLATVDEFSNLLNDLTRSSQWTVGTKQLVDHRNLDLSQLQAEDIRRIRNIVMLYSDRLGISKCAFVVQGSMGLLSAESYCFIAEDAHEQSRVFTSRQDAQNWLIDNYQ
jgi:hypothetical protein